MDDVSISLLLGILALLIACSAFFSSSETGMMSLNRYRLRHLVKKNHRGAIRANHLLERPDRLIGVILIGNNLVNICAASIATVVAVRLWGDAGIAIATFGLTLIILIFAEVTPKTLAALHPEKIAFPAALILRPLLALLYPAVWMVNGITNGLLKLFGVKMSGNDHHHLSTEELRTLVNEAGALLPQRNQSMLLGILELEEVRVQDVMIPRNEVVGIDLEAEDEEILAVITDCDHTRLPVYKGDINQVVGILHLRNMTKVFNESGFSKAALLQVIREPYFIPETTQLQTQLFHFQKEGRRIGLVVDEYGDIQGICTLEDILEEIVGELTDDRRPENQDIHPQDDGTYFIDGSATIRDINKAMDWELPVDGPKTLNGLITERLEFIPETNVCLQIDRHRIETIQVQDNLVKMARVSAPLNVDS
ncbi:HlyC/CorC family transporter [Motiliproteus coralliicola]|uniref:Magnesium and cobalt efflux protein CorC n=1 Tax=Motiliproteus coralliicola TaxID=2283196 RepID=A0A369WMC3_9GAMM|nr:HlyC/CorC family transporter [Motiliproteus coralliicola]RDE22631.1 HlyC/CorC family transporter [Motiliproteus coralliicola]